MPTFDQPRQSLLIVFVRWYLDAVVPSLSCNGVCQAPFAGHFVKLQDSWWALCLTISCVWTNVHSIIKKDLQGKTGTAVRFPDVF